MKKRVLFLTGMIMMIVMLSACGASEDHSKKEKKAGYKDAIKKYVNDFEQGNMISFSYVPKSVFKDFIEAKFSISFEEANEYLTEYTEKTHDLLESYGGLNIEYNICGAEKADELDLYRDEIENTVLYDEDFDGDEYEKIASGLANYLIGDYEIDIDRDEFKEIYIVEMDYTAYIGETKVGSEDSLFIIEYKYDEDWYILGFKGKMIQEGAIASMTKDSEEFSKLSEELGDATTELNEKFNFN